MLVIGPSWKCGGPPPAGIVRSCSQLGTCPSLVGGQRLGRVLFELFIHYTYVRIEAQLTAPMHIHVTTFTAPSFPETSRRRYVCTITINGSRIPSLSSGLRRCSSLVSKRSSRRFMAFASGQKSIWTSSHLRKCTGYQTCTRSTNQAIMQPGRNISPTGHTLAAMHWIRSTEMLISEKPHELITRTAETESHAVKGYGD